MFLLDVCPPSSHADHPIVPHYYNTRTRNCTFPNASIDWAGAEGKQQMTGRSGSSSCCAGPRIASTNTTTAPAAEVSKILLLLACTTSRYCTSNWSDLRILIGIVACSCPLIVQFLWFLLTTPGAILSMTVRNKQQTKMPQHPAPAAA